MVTEEQRKLFVQLMRLGNLRSEEVIAKLKADFNIDITKQDLELMTRWLENQRSDF